MQGWLKKAIETHNFHCEKLRNHKSWTLRDTSELLRRSLGAVSQDIQIARLYVENPSFFNSIEHVQDALEALRNRKRVPFTPIKLSGDTTSA